MKQTLQLKLGQQLTMTPQLQQAIRLLQLSSLELQTEIQEILETNPMLEALEDASQNDNADSSGDSDDILTEGSEASSGETEKLTSTNNEATEEFTPAAETSVSRVSRRSAGMGPQSSADEYFR